MKNLFLHLDLDAFFATAEQAKNSNLRNKPLVVGTPSKRAVITAASYEARRYGIKAGMPFFIAKEKCKNLIIVPADFNLYSKYSSLFFKLLKNHVINKIQIASIDECNIDVTRVWKNIPYNYINKMREIQELVYKKLNLKVSLGLSFNIEFAKIAAEINKPMGLKIVTEENYQKEIWPLPVEKISGIGKATLPHINALQINTIGDLAKYNNLHKLKNIMGKMAEYYWNIAKGNGTTYINFDTPDQKSISKEHTFDKVLLNDKDILEFLKQLSININQRVLKLSQVYKVIRISYKNMEGFRHSIQVTLNEKTDKWENIWKVLPHLYEQISDKKPFKLLSFGVAQLENKYDYYYRLGKDSELTNP